MKGTYLLVMALPKDTSIIIGKHGVIHFQKGCYAYVGSALNGLEQRIQRHLRKQKKDTLAYRLSSSFHMDC